MSGLLIEGERQIGKSHLLHEVLSKSGKSYGGYYVQRVMCEGKNYGFAIQKLTAGIPIQLTVDRSQVHPKNLFIYAEGEQRIVAQHCFDAVAIEALEEAVKRKTDVIVLDELGGVELLSADFCDTLKSVLLHQNIVGTFKQDDNLSEIQRRAGLSEVRLKEEREKLKKWLVLCNVQVITLAEQNRQTVKGVLRDYLV